MSLNLEHLVNKWGFTDILSIKETKLGNVNNNWIVSTPQDKYILK